MQKRNSVSLQYLAGFIDGEGCINFAKNRGGIFPRILVTNTNIEILNLLKENFGGDVTVTKVKDKENWKPRGVWRLSWAKAIELVEQLHEHLKIKQKQVELVIAYDVANKGAKSKLSIERKQFFINEMHKLNRKGV